MSSLRTIHAVYWLFFTTLLVLALVTYAVLLHVTYAHREDRQRVQATGQLRLFLKGLLLRTERVAALAPDTDARAAARAELWGHLERFEDAFTGLELEAEREDAIGEAVGAILFQPPLELSDELEGLIEQAEQLVDDPGDQQPGWTELLRERYQEVDQGLVAIDEVYEAHANYVASRALRVQTFALGLLVGVHVATAWLVFAQLQRRLLRHARELERTAGELRRSREEIAGQKGLLEAILDSMGDAVVVMDSERRLILANPALRDLAGRDLPAGEVLSWTEDFELLLPDRQTTFPPDAIPLARALRGEEVDGVEAFLRWHDGREVWLEVSARPVQLAGHEEPVGLVVCHDLTRRKQAERGLEEKARQLERSNRDLEQFAYVASHDLQEPLRIVMRFSELLQRRYAGRLDEQADELIELISDGARRMQKLIGDLLRYARVQERGLQRGSVDTGALVDKAIDRLRLAIEEAGARVERGDLPEVVADPDLLAQVLHNLIGNALKFRGPQPPVVRVTARRAEGGWTFAVRDNGIGFAMEHAARIFDPFQRLHGIGEYSGTGIGLALCKRIIERHGGHIWAESGPGDGATFSFHLPDAEPSPPDEAAPDAPADGDATER